MNDDIKELVDVIMKNPDLPVFLVVYNSFIVCFDGNPFDDSTVGKVENIRIMKYCTYIIDGKIHFATEEDKEILEFEYPELVFNWKEAIFFDIGVNGKYFSINLGI